MTEETRGGEIPGDWKVAGDAAARAAAVRAQHAVLGAYTAKDSDPEGNAE